ncbi:MAG TPA: ABC transporter ATP-binding protein, partial [Thermoanaerobaculia bacterium]|nr:ABC transporter ATP-binding protein [Thermoanaerobaculia bacterium]
MSVAIRAERLGKRYRRLAPGHRLRTLKSAFVGRSLDSGAALADTIPALEEVSFEVERGELFSVIGGNGSGKSTLLKLVAGILRPSSGALTVDGRVTALIELGAGFHPEISGRENVYIAGAVLGLTRRAIEARYEKIVEFSGLAGFLEEPVKNYSSGMYVRLGFAVAIHTDPEILLVDEVLAVGDEAFAHRCLRKIEELLAAGGTVVFVSHSLDLVEEMSTRALWLDRGRARLVGEPRRVVDAY